jgi:hypothetical protein
MTGVGLLDIEQFQVPLGILRDIQSALQAGGVLGEERFVLLSGVRRKPRQALIRSAAVPAQIATAHEQGLSITIEGEELRRLNQSWAQRGEQLLAQVHSHPRYPFHSPVDDRYPIVTVEGGLSIVVPTFGFCTLTDLRSCAVFRLVEGEWEWVPPREVDKLVHVI